MIKKIIFPVVIFLIILLFTVSFLTSCNYLQIRANDKDQNAGISQQQSAGQAVVVESDKEQAQSNTEGNEQEEPEYINIWIEPLVPESMKLAIYSNIEKSRKDFMITKAKDESDIAIDIEKYGNIENSSFVIVPVVSFFNLNDSISSADIIDFWEGSSDSIDHICQVNSDRKLFLTKEVYNILAKLFGKCENPDVEILEEEEIFTMLTEEKGMALVPFENIKKEYKVLRLDDMDIFDSMLNMSEYNLCFSLDVSSESVDIEESLKTLYEEPISNRDPGQLMTVNMTGVTAPAQGKSIGRQMNEYGATYPAEKIVDILKDADITHISNEIPFVENCTGSIYIETGNVVFCCKPEHIELLRFVGTDVIELTGNHMNDYGNEWMDYTLDMYDNENWPYFGGGRDLEDSLIPATFDINGNKIAFLGANTFGPMSNWAEIDRPGSASINVTSGTEMEENFEEFGEIIKGLKQQDYNVIFTFQYTETYNYKPYEQQVIDFRRMIGYGADIVSGSQSHQPMGVEFADDGFINYGLGNLFFNQADELVKKQGIIAKHIFYKNEHINTILITTMLENLSQPRITTQEERVLLLDSIFNGSIRSDNQ